MQNDFITRNEKNERTGTWKQCLLDVGSHNSNYTLYIYNLILKKITGSKKHDRQ